MTSRSDKPGYATAFGEALDAQLAERGLAQRALAAATKRSPAYVNQTIHGSRRASAQWVELIADVLKVSEAERVRLHRAAASDLGFKLDLSEPSAPSPARPDRKKRR